MVSCLDYDVNPLRVDRSMAAEERARGRRSRKRWQGGDYRNPPNRNECTGYVRMVSLSSTSLCWYFSLSFVWCVDVGTTVGANSSCGGLSDRPTTQHTTQTPRKEGTEQEREGGTRKVRLGEHCFVHVNHDSEEVGGSISRVSHLTIHKFAPPSCHDYCFFLFVCVCFPFVLFVVVFSLFVVFWLVVECSHLSNRSLLRSTEEKQQRRTQIKKYPTQLNHITLKRWQRHQTHCVLIA